MSKLIYLAKEKFKQSNSVDFSIPLNDFVADCYVRLKPCSYGMRIQKKIVLDLGVNELSPSLNQGDIVIGNKFIEIKTSFLSGSRTYSITHMRMWQKFSYYLFCFIDCEDNFTPKFFLVDKYIMNYFKLSPMNGTKESNSENYNIELRVTIKKASSEYKILEKHNKLKGCEFEYLQDFAGYMACAA